MRHLVKSELRWPGLWRHCSAAFNFQLGPSGNRAYDWSLKNNHTTPNGGVSPVWTPEHGGAIQCASATSLVATLAYTPGTSYTYSYWAKQTLSDRCIVVGNTSADYVLLAWPSQNIVYKNVAGTVINWTVPGSDYFSKLTHFCIVRNNTNVTLYLNGRSYGDKTLSSNVTAGYRNIAGPNGAGQFSFGGNICEVMSHEIPISTSHVQLLARYPGIAYETRARRRSVAVASGFNPAWARRQSLIIGGGLQ
jgi:hypothetical protein